MSRSSRTLAVAASSLFVVAMLAPAAQAAPLNYVAMGDSYSAGSGILPLSTAKANPICTQSSKNYAHDLAAEHDYSLTDVTCGAAVTADFSGRQFGIVTPQADALSSTTDLVTLTIGGNDNGVFIGMMAACASAGVVSAGQGSPCKAIYGNTFVNQINNSTYPRLVKAFQLIHQKAPNARVFAAGYPHILPESGKGCFATMPIASGDFEYVNGVEKALNGAIQRAAKESGVTYVDSYTPSAGHDACQAPGSRWVEPALFGSNYIPVHPNALGEQAYAREFDAAIGN